MFRKEFEWFKSNTTFYRKTPTFWIWETIIIYSISRLWKYITILLLIFYTLNLILLIKNNIKIKLYGSDNLWTHINYVRINFFIAIGDSKNKNKNVSYLIFTFIFKQVIGFSYRVIKLSINLYHAFEKEYKWSNIKKKKKTIKITKQFLHNVLKHFIFIEFIKKQPIIEKTMIINIGKFKRKIIIEIIEN